MHSLRAIWSKEGIDTAPRAEEYLQRLMSRRTREGEIIQLLDLPRRPLVEREQKYISGWVDMGFDNEALRLAYEKTVMGTASKSMDWRYMNKILLRWHEKGLHTVAQIQTGDHAGAQTGRGNAAPISPAQGPDRQAQKDMEYIRRLMQEMTQEQGG